ncbi:hypothetical protein QN277_017583 [Acacia crassicarpa]|uniref:RING-type E3 ubiquitin transferase n=1 Tax=Acacia crassicarpa TaxID=499986 RepID=A0AAE1JTY7_9FABA|nr:hypothetical protein QN277_017583 [Acacia crassicarpa]
MDKDGDKRAVERNVVSRKGMPRLFRRSPPNTKDLGVQLCSRPNCSSKIYSSIIAENGSCVKGKPLRSPIQSSLSGKETVGRSCRTFSGISNPRKSLKEPQQRTLPSRLETDSSDASSIQDEPEVSVRVPSSSPATYQSQLQAEQALVKVASTCGFSRTRSQRSFHQSGLRGQEAKSTGSVTRAGISRYVKCNSINDVSSTDCSSSDSTINRRKDMVKRRNCEKQSSSSARGKKLSGSLLEGQSSSSVSGISISGPRRSRNVHAHVDNIASVRTQRSMSGRAGEGLPRRRPGSSNRPPSSPSESDTTRPLINQSRRRYQNSIAEEIHLLETNFLLNGLYSYDQHRDMRMDIDNMSYEELLALEERMGTVSTALTEEALSECLKRSIFQPTPSNEEEDHEMNKNTINDVIKCSICQDEYVVGDELGGLKCEHRYHVACIQQWLRLKNWCPICKASAAPSSSSVASNQD